ncbi:MAG: alcohol dehydrogenase catalytic domain-containing protein, partial [Anaerolineae bacterium]|nr:alcohol dehydrogenase catalytic domain-containing protein [Anaerolineae bacterium]
MRALTFDGALRLVEDAPEPVPAPGEALIRIRAAGICQTDLEMTRGYRPFSGILGHEFVGELLEDAGSLRAGQRVAGEINAACGVCDLCADGMPTHCRQRTVLGIQDRQGVFAERVALPIVNLHTVPDSVPDEAATFTEPLAAALEALEQVHIRPTRRVALIGAGRLGLLVAQVLKLAGADLTVLARHERALALLAGWQIPALDIRREGWLDEYGRNTAHIVVECTGNPDGLALALDMIRPRGTLVLKSTYAGTPPADLSRVVVQEITLVGSRCGPFEPALRLLEARRVDVLPLVERIYPL